MQECSCIQKLGLSVEELELVVELIKASTDKNKNNKSKAVLAISISMKIQKDISGAWMPISLKSTFPAPSCLPLAPP